MQKLQHDRPPPEDATDHSGIVQLYAGGLVEKVSEDVRFYRSSIVVYYSVFLVGIVVGAGVVDLPNTDTYLDAIWLFADINSALMAIPNLIGLLLLNRIVVGMVKDYFAA